MVSHPALWCSPMYASSKPQGVQPLNKLQVPVQGQGGVLSGPVEGRHENPEFHSIRRRHVKTPV